MTGTLIQIRSSLKIFLVMSLEICQMLSSGSMAVPFSMCLACHYEFQLRLHGILLCHLFCVLRSPIVRDAGLKWYLHLHLLGNLCGQPPTRILNLFFYSGCERSKHHMCLVAKELDRFLQKSHPWTIRPRLYLVTIGCQ